MRAQEIIIYARARNIYIYANICALTHTYILFLARAYIYISDTQHTETAPKVLRRTRRVVYTTDGVDGAAADLKASSAGHVSRHHVEKKWSINCTFCNSSGRYSKQGVCSNCDQLRSMWVMQYHMGNAGSPFLTCSIDGYMSHT